MTEKNCGLMILREDGRKNKEHRTEKAERKGRGQGYGDNSN
jgi:hypothetical protein